MGVKLDELVHAAQRLESYKQSQIQAAPEQIAEERLKLGIRNAEQFTSKSDRLRVLNNAHLRATAKETSRTEQPGLLSLQEAGQEIAFGDNDLRPIRYLHIALLAAKAVGKITVRGVFNEEGDATGFLVAPGLLLTNWHVLKTAHHAEASFVSFDYEDGLDGKPRTPKLFDLNPQELFIADQELDYAFVAVTPSTAQGAPLTEFGYLRLFEQTGKVDPNSRQAANIIQHPLGQDKRLAIRDNYFMEPPKDRLDAAKNLNSLFYGTDTLKGSSGSPVCTDEWFVVALHRGGVPKLKTIKGKQVVVRRDGTPARDGDARATIDYETNEGTRISRIYASLREKIAVASTDATHAQTALSKISAVSKDPLQGPVQLPTSRLGIPEAIASSAGGVEEKLTRRPDTFFTAPGVDGYNPKFLGNNQKVDLPTLSFEALKEVAKLKGSDEYVLNYRNYSIVMHAKRRTAIFAAGNVDGNLLWKNVMGGAMPKRPQWTFDPRMEDKFQPDDAIFSNAMQRGHLFKREDATQGHDEDELNEADKHSFVITNATPMIANFNNVEWGDLEDLITDHLQQGNKVSYFAGPIFDVEDKYFNQLKAGVPPAQRRKGMRVPTQFWKVVAWVERGKLKAAGFILDQSDEIRERGPITEEMIDFGEYEQTLISTIEERTGLSFPQLVAADTYQE